eukprot:g2794.t1
MYALWELWKKLMDTTSSSSGEAISTASKSDDGNDKRVEHIFAYGTLRADYSPEGDRWGIACDRCAWRHGTAEGFRMYQNPDEFFPFCVRSTRKKDTIRGTLLSWPGDRATFDEKLKKCDKIEGYPGYLYDRTTVDVRDDSGKRVPAFIYFLTREPEPDSNVLRFPEGDWFNGKKHKKMGC